MMFKQFGRRIGAALALSVAFWLAGAEVAEAQRRQTITISGTGGNDIIAIAAGNYTVNGVATPFARAAINVFVVHGGGGNDTVTVVDGAGDDQYLIFLKDAAVGPVGDSVSITDGPGRDTYRVETGNNHDTVTVVDGPNGDGIAPGWQNYYIDTNDGCDTVTITDGAHRDSYRVYLGDGADTLNVTDASGPDEYHLFGGNHPPRLGDSLNITDDFEDRRPLNDIVNGPFGFELITGRFQ